MTDREQESVWVLRAQLGARDALDALFRAVQAPLYRCLLGLVGRPALAEDLLQEVLLRVYRGLGALRDPALFRPWCFRIATREAFRRLKAERRWQAQLGHDEALAAAAAPAIEEKAGPGLLAELPALLPRVSPASRAVLVLHYHNGLSLDEVAAVLGVPPGTAKSRLAYGLAALRRLMKEKTDGREAPGARA